MDADAMAEARAPRHAGRLILLHWVIAALVFCIWPLGLMIGFVRDDVKLGFYLLHESLGFLVLWLMLLRVGARLTSPSPVPFGTAPMRQAAGLVHGLLYLLLVVMPVSGFLATNAHGFPLLWFGLVPVWSPIGKMPDIAGTLSTVHTVSAWMLLSLIGLHLGAVIYHQAIRRDGILQRMS
ncbi:cytochrome b [Rhizobium sp. CC-YZS058]|uniref:cytochrome b n=1 Tax=Rhizobium sp. CC-YZS058 TaxID=3042153 RepID=UPI002B057A9D|nr:cytochrome b/b6 domain-containing protein [Rhizobium sp. CC-YZS058]MEA3536788.1 cytochrome b/b6 domain-containing protein [Rhizobium sp. CC-YZS058]